MEHFKVVGKIDIPEKTVLRLKYIGTDCWDRPVYEDQNGKLWKDTNLKPYGSSSMYSAFENDFYGEPDLPINCEYEIDC